MQMYGKKVGCLGDFLSVNDISDISNFINNGEGTVDDFEIMPVTKETLPTLGWDVTGDLPEDMQGLAILYSTLPNQPKHGDLSGNIVMCRINPVDGALDPLDNMEDALSCEDLLRRLTE